MTSHLRACLLALPIALLATAPAQAASIFGRWLTDDGSAVVRVEACGAKLCGIIEHVLDPRAPKTDINNPDRARRAQPLVGTAVLSAYRGSGSVWKNGRAYDPKAGKSYASDLRLLADGRLKVTGCVTIICRSRYWTRAK